MSLYSHCTIIAHNIHIVESVKMSQIIAENNVLKIQLTSYA